MRLWDSATGQLQQTFSGHSSPVTSFDISHDNERIVSGSDEGVIKLWNATTGELQQTFEGHSDYVYTVVFSPDGQSIASGSADGTINIWIHTQSGPLQTLKGHSGGVDSVAFSPDGQRLVSGSMNDKTIKLWGPTMSQRTETLEEQSGSPRSVAFSPDGRQLASGSKDGTITLWILTADALLPARTLQSRGATSVAFSPNSEKLATGSDGTVELWDLRTYEVERTCVGQSRKREYAGTTSLTFSPDGRYLAFDPLDKTLRVWDLTTNDPPRILSGHARSIKSFVFLPGGQQLATASDDNTIKIWDLTAGESQQVTNEEGVPGSTKSIAFSPGGEQLATGLSDGTIKIWEPSTGKMKRRFQAHEYAVQSVAFSAEGYRPLVLASGSDTTIRLWDPQTGQKAWPLHLLLSAEVRSLCFLPDNRLVSGWNSGHITVRNIKIWNITTSQRDKTFSAHEASVESISLTEDGQMVSGSGDGTCKLWDLAAPTDQPKQVFHSVDGDFAAPLRTIAISPKDQQLAGSAPNGPTNVWNLSKNPSRQIHKRHSNWVWTSSGARISILDGQWICLNGERTLWLPKQYRAECLAVSHERIALGHPSGNVSFIMMPQARA
jgi:WD40 repeat protein